MSTRGFLNEWLKPLYLKDGHMTEERFNELSPEEWSEYKYGGQYLKTFYDIKLTDGTVHLNRYPNAGNFSLRDGGSVAVKDIIEFKLADKNTTND